MDVTSDLPPASRLLAALRRSSVRVALAFCLVLIGYFLLVSYFVDSYNLRMYDLRKEELKRLVEVALNAVEPIRAQQRRGEISAGTARTMGVDLIRRMTYTTAEGSNYLFMSSYTGEMLVQPFEPEKEGTSQWDLVDVNGKYIIRALIAAATAPAGQGYVEYYYPAPGSKQPQLKLSYVVGIPEWNSYIGTGLYMWDVGVENQAYLRNSFFLLLGLGLFLFAVLFVALRPMMRTYRTLLQLFDQVRRRPDELPHVPSEGMRAGSEEWQLLTGFKEMLGRIDQSHQELRESQDRFEVVMRGTNDGLWDWNLATDEVYYSPGWKSMLGYAEDEVANVFDSWRRLVHPDDLDQSIAQIRAHLDGRTPVYRREHRLLHKGGTYRWILARGVAMRDASGKPYRMAGSHTDITDRKRAETALQERLAFESLITSISTEFILLQPDEIDAGIQHTLQVLGESTASDRSYVFLFSDDGCTMDNTHEWCREGIEPLKPLYQAAPVEKLGWCVARIKRGEVVHVPSIADLPGEAATDRDTCLAHPLPTRSMLLVPIIDRGVAVGFFGFDSVRAEKRWTDDSIALLKLVSDIIINALERKRAEAIEAGQRQFLELLATGGSFSETLHALVRVIEEQWPGMLGLILLLDEDRKHLRVGAFVSLPAEYARSIEGLEIGPMVGSCGTACYRHERVIVEDIAVDPKWAGLRDLGLRYGLRACWSEPVFSATGDVVGTFAMYYRSPRIPHEPELRTIETAAHLVGIAVEHRQAQEELQTAYQTLERRVQERTHELAALNAIAGVVSRSLDLKEIMRDALDKTLEVMGMEVGVAYRLEGAWEERESPPFLVPMAARGMSSGFVEAVSRIPVAGTMIEKAAALGRPIVWPGRDYPITELRQAGNEEGMQLGISVPLMVKGKLVGAIFLGARTLRTVTPEEQSLLAAIGQQVGVAVENARLYVQAEKSATMAERGRLARELHDSVTQSLYSVTMYAEAAARLLTAGQPATAAEHLRELRDTAQEALREMRLLIFELRPPALEKTGLTGALQTRLEAVEMRGGIKAELRVQDAQIVDHLPLDVQHEVYNIAQEALNNALRHAQAHQVRVDLTFSGGQMRLEVYDDGIGFEPAIARLGGGFGLSGMDDRASRLGGTIRVESAPGRGTRVSVEVPVLAIA